MPSTDTASARTDWLGLPEELRGQVVPVLDFGSQYVQLIARRVREAGVFSVLVRHDIPARELAAMKPVGLILSGGPSSVYEADAPRCDPELFDLNVPVLGICYGMQMGCRLLGAEIESAAAREFGRAALHVVCDQDLLAGVPEHTSVWMSHGDQVVPKQEDLDDFERLAATPTCPFAAVRHKRRAFFGVQFHPEVTHTPHGVDVISNFLFKICGAAGAWRMADFLESQVRQVREQVGRDRVVCGLSGGVDSSVVAGLLHRAIGEQLSCIFVDNGLLRAGERELVESTFLEHFNIDLQVVDARAEFLADLKGIEDPQEKRRLIGHRFIEVFKHASRDIVDANHLAQGTLYPDVIESGHAISNTGTPKGSGGALGSTANIKLHHNVGGLPEELGFNLIEPLRSLFKDEARKLGEILGLPEQIVWRHPFPGPGLAVRVLGEVDGPKLDLLRACDEILLEEIVTQGLYRKTSQVFAVLLPVKAVGVMGDDRTYEHVVALRAVETQDFMTADWARIPYEVLATISNRIINEVRGVNRVVYDISSKPPATIEWE